MACIIRILVAHWRGDLSLLVSVGGILVLGRVALYWLAFWTMALPVEWRVMAGLADIMVLIWQITGATRAAARHQTETGDPMPVWLTYGAVLAGLGSGGAGVLTSLLGVPVPPAYVPPETGVTRQGPDLMLEGPITFAMLKGVKANLSGPAPPMSLVLNSDGGMVVAARAIATEVLKKGMDTQVTGRCASACTLIFLAGRERHLTPGGQIGFHSYRLEHPNPVIDAESELAKDRHYLATRGVTADFLDQAFSRSGSENMWFPDHQTLLHGGVVTR